MKFEVYRQDEGDREIISKAVTRYHTENEDKAFAVMELMNEQENKNVWRVAKTINHHILFDLDGNDINNLKTIIRSYEKLFGKFQIIKSYSGYHLISKRYEDTLEWQYNTCRVLYPELERKDLQKYIEAIKEFNREENKRQQVLGLNRIDFLNSFANNFKQSGLFIGTGDFDIYFSIAVISRGYYCLRISKKAIEDNPREVIIEELENIVKT